MKASEDALIEISDKVLDGIRRMSHDEFREALVHQDYHDFGKDDFAGDFVPTILSEHGLTKADVQIDIISVATDLTHQVHYHNHAHAYVVVLGASEHVPDPQTAEAYVNGKWFAVSAGRALSIPPGTHHGFRVRTNANDILHFLSVQSPPIVAHDHDDYHRSA